MHRLPFADPPPCSPTGNYSSMLRAHPFNLASLERKEQRRGDHLGGDQYAVLGNRSVGVRFSVLKRRLQCHQVD